MFILCLSVTVWAGQELCSRLLPSLTPGYKETKTKQNDFTLKNRSCADCSLLIVDYFMTKSLKYFSYIILNCIQMLNTWINNLIL